MDPDHDLRDFDNVCRLFPLPNVVLLPHVILPLHIFEPRYRQMTEDALASDRLITIVQIRPDADWKSDAEPAIEQVACLGKILDCERLLDGRFNFLLVGRKRVRLRRELPKTKLYRQAEVEILEDETPEEPLDVLRSELIARFRDLNSVLPELDPEMARLLDSDLALGPLTDILGHSLGLPANLKQSFLAEPRVDQRARSLVKILGQILGPGDLPQRPFPPPFSPN
ncbi:LON peptidase substrate-binding domain-containing protein [soil metagenome]